MIEFKRNRLSLLISLTLAGAASPAFAQQIGEAGLVEEVMVTASPIRDSQKAAIDAKRDAYNNVDVISADTIGRFPDQNLADSLGRVPGLAIERDQGQARYINFRGAPFRYTSLAIDGLSIPGAENGRVPRFDSFPSVITSRIDANKAIMPNMPGEAVSGYINISTFDPFAQRGWAFSTDVGMGNQELGDGDIEKLSLRTSWSNDSFGFSLFSSENSREQITDNREYDLSRDGGELSVNELDFRSYKVTREDRAYGGRFEFRGDGALERVFVSSLYNEFQDFEERNQFVFDFAGGAGAAGAPQAVGERAENQYALATRSLEYGLYENSTFTNTLGVDFALGDWYLESRLNVTETENSTFLPMPYSSGGFVMASYDVSDLYDPAVGGLMDSTGTPIGPNDISYPPGGMLAMTLSAAMNIDATKFKLDAERDLQLFGSDSVLQAGLEMDSREAGGHGMVTAMGLWPSEVNIADYATDKPWDSGFDNGIGATYYDNKALRSAWSRAVGGLAVTPHDSQKIRLEEDVSAAYAMVTTEYGWGNLVLGTRVENTDYLSEGPTGNFEDSFTNFLPSAHLNIDLADDVKLRLSTSTGVSRPTYSEWRGADMVDMTGGNVTAGNPALAAEESWGADAAIEWYPGDASLMSAGLFSRSIDDVIYARSSVIDGDDYLPEAGLDEWTYTEYVNGSNGEMRGAEFNAIAQASDFLPALSGFGISANLTLLDSEFETLEGSRHSLPGTSDTIVNTSVFYEMEGLSIRLNHQYRDDWLSTTENVGMTEYWAEQKRLDLAVSYELPQPVFGASVSLYANANNLTDEEDVRYEGDISTPNQVEGYGRRYLAGFRANF